MAIRFANLAEGCKVSNKFSSVMLFESIKSIYIILVKILQKAKIMLMNVSVILMTSFCILQRNKKKTDESK